MDKDEINIPQRGRPRKSREMGFQSSTPVQQDRVQIDFEGMLDMDRDESVNDLLQREYRKYVDRNKLDINQNNIENYLKPMDLNRKWSDRGDKPWVNLEKRNDDARKEMFQSQGQILSHISSIFPDKSASEDFAMPHLKEERIKRSEAQIEMKLGLTARDVSEYDEFLVGQFQGSEHGIGGGVTTRAKHHANDGKAIWAIGSGSARNEGCGDNASLAAPVHSTAYGSGECEASHDHEISSAKQDDVCGQKVCPGEALGYRGSMSDVDYCAERYGNQEACINKNSEFSTRFGARHEGDFYGLEPRQSSHCNLYSTGQTDVTVDYSQRRFCTRDQKITSMSGKHGGGGYGRTHHREPMYHYEMHEYHDHMQNDGLGRAFPIANCNFAVPMSEQPDVNSFSMCRQGRFQDGMHGTEGFAGYKRDEPNGFSQQRVECSFAEQEGVGEPDMAQQSAYWREGSVGYQSSMQYPIGADELRFQGGRRAPGMIQNVHSGYEPPPHFYRQQDGDKFSASDQNFAQYINSKYNAGTSLGQTLSHLSNVSSFEPNPNNPLFQNYSMWVNRKKRKNNPLLWQYINQGHSIVHPSKYSNLDYVHKKMYLGTITQIPIEKNNHQILPLFLNSTSNTPEFVKIGGIFLEKTLGLNYDNVTVMQLKNLMKEFGLCHNGKKTELIERVKATVEKIELKMDKTKELQSAVCHDSVEESREESGNVDMNDITDDTSFMYF